MKFYNVILNNGDTNCICCPKSSHNIMCIDYATIPFKYLKHIKQYIFFVKICRYCYHNMNHKKEIKNKIINKTCILIDNF